MEGGEAGARRRGLDLRRQSVDRAERDDARRRRAEVSPDVGALRRARYAGQRIAQLGHAPCRCPTCRTNRSATRRKYHRRKIQGEARPRRVLADREEGRRDRHRSPATRRAVRITVVVHVSKGADLVVVPDVTLRRSNRPRPDLAAAGLQVGNVKNYRPGGVVMSQDPIGGTDTKVPRGTQVDLVLVGGAGGPPAALSGRLPGRCLRSAPPRRRPGAEHGCTRRTGRDHHRRGTRSRPGARPPLRE